MKNIITAGILCKLTKSKENIIKSKNTKINCLNYDRPRVCTFIHSKYKTLYIIFRSSKTLINIWNNLHIYKEKQNSKHHEKIHSGFLNIYKKVKNKINKFILSNINKIDKIIIGGHSLGAALSTLCIINLPKKVNIKKIYNITFALPPTGNHSFIKKYAQSISSNNNIHIVIDKDIIPQINNKTSLIKSICKKFNYNQMDKNHIYMLKSNPKNSYLHHNMSEYLKLLKVTKSDIKRLFKNINIDHKLNETNLKI